MTSRETGSISFDRAADYYDKTRSLTPEAHAAVIELLGDELGGRKTLEIGVGTGRVALPLHDLGIEMIGLDLSAAMMAKLVERAGPGVFPLVRGDATALPFRDDSFDAVVASWVLHLVTDWRDVLSGIARVLRRGGVFLVTEGPLDPKGVHTEMTRRFRSASGVGGWPRGPLDYPEIDDEARSLGATPRRLPPIVETRTEMLEARVAALEAGFFSASWDLTEEQRRAAANEVRAWARSEIGDLETPREVTTAHEWRAYDF